MLDRDPLWYKDAVVYQAHVRAMRDANGDGIGDFAGFTRSLDYVQDLGVSVVWLMPFYPSPLRDDGYDISDFTGVNPSYGSTADFRRFLKEAHRRGLRVVTELVLNHTSDQHEWFQRARQAAPGTSRRNFYVWSDDPDRYDDARIIFRDFETSNWTWDAVAGQYYWHRFYSHQPDLNFENPAVRKAVLRSVDFWLDMGVDGLRLDAVPYLFEREGTTCENLPETHEFLRELRCHVDARHPGRMLLAEANQWPEDAISYFGAGDECHMAFHFPVMPRLFMAINQGDRFPIIDILQSTPPIPDVCQWALFLRNHDELTLEMVTDEERDYMYRSFARDRRARVNLGIRRRLAPLLGNDRRKIELMNGLLFSLPGTPILYYGDEIGMGDNIFLGDRDAVRTPMQWSSDRNAGFSRANSQSLYLPVVTDPEYHYEAVNVEAQQANPSSLLWWTHRLIALRRRFRAFGRGTLEFLHPNNHRVLAFVRRYEDERILVVANLCGHAAYVELDLNEYRGRVPVELFGQSAFPPVGELPYLLTLGPYAFYWMSLEEPQVRYGVTGATDIPGASVGPGGAGLPREEAFPTFRVRGRWDGLLRGRERPVLERALPGFLVRQRWYRGKARTIQTTRVGAVLELPARTGDERVVLALVEVSYTEGEAETYVLPLTFAGGDQAERVLRDNTNVVVGLVEGERSGVLCDAFVEPTITSGLLDTVLRRRRWRGAGGDVVGRRAAVEAEKVPSAAADLEARVSEAEQSNTSVVYGDRAILKLYRLIEPGENPEVEVGRFLARVRYGHAPTLLGHIEFRPADGEVCTLGILQELVGNEGDAWSFTLDELDLVFQRVLAMGDEDPEPLPEHGFSSAAGSAMPARVAELVAGYSETAELIGVRTAELHRALASSTDDPAFAPEPFTALDRRSLHQQISKQVRQAIQLLRQVAPGMNEAARADAELLVERRRDLLDVLAPLRERDLTGLRCRCHGDFHLGQLLYTGRDFVVVDFEGEPGRAIGERRLKRSPLRDVAGMLRSFDYATAAALDSVEARGVAEPGGDTFARLAAWARQWRWWVSSVFLRSYLDTAGGAAYMPDTTAEVDLLLNAHMIDKALYELAYELQNRPSWVHIPLRGILELLGASEA